LQPDDDTALRIAAIGHVEALSRASHDAAIDWAQIDVGFEFRGRRLHLANRTRGIFWPAPLRTGALSIKTVIPRVGRHTRYDDAELGSDAPWFEYRYQGTDASARDNVRLRQCLESRLPIIYFYGVSEARYRSLLCHVVGDDPARLTFQVAPIEAANLVDDPVLRQAPIVRFERSYAITTVRRRLHQDRFRAAVLDAYSERCAICRLRGARLLDAAHIVPDHEQLGEAKVPNGLALCKLHHAAFDGDLLGVTPDLEVRLASGLLDERDGPMLEYGLRRFHGARIEAPTQLRHRPDRDLLAVRFERFQRVA
jgi:putative restriction endonuclease